VQRQIWGGFSAPHCLLPLEPHARFERNQDNLFWLGQQMCDHRVVHLVLALWGRQIEVLEVSRFVPIEPWLEGCVPVLLEPHQLEAYCGAAKCQLELIQCFAGVFEVRWLEIG
jgi:hypothetical protein